jgi:hypothetical protein
MAQCGQNHLLPLSPHVGGMNPHIPKGVSTLGVGVLVDSQMFREQLQGSKPNGLKSSLYHWKAIKT